MCFIYLLTFLLNIAVHAAVPQEVMPYLMPANHPAKPGLDKIFANPEVIHSRETLIKAGFHVSKPRKADNIFVAKHKKVKGYVIKLYTDDQGVLPDWHNWVKRVQGAIVIQQAIEQHGFQHFFRVPKKWIYPLLRNAVKPEEKLYVLIAEEMQLVDPHVNQLQWKNRDYITKEKLKALYTLLNEESLIDSVYIDNIPFDIDGYIVFIDTEHFHTTEKPVDYNRLTSNLPKKLQSFWTDLFSK